MLNGDDFGDAARGVKMSCEDTAVSSHKLDALFSDDCKHVEEICEP
jgi:hypothetical protein